MKYLFPLLIFLFFSCQNDKNVIIPPQVLSKEKMIPLLEEIHLAQSGIKIKNLKPDSAEECLAYLYQHIYSSLGTTKKQVDESLDFYCKNPELLDSIYENVLNELSKKQALEKQQLHTIK